MALGFIVLLPAAAAAKPAGAAASAQAGAEKRPNVLIVLTDDQGLGDFSFTGNPVLKTPNLDAFARQSLRLVDFHVAPMCTPTRGQLMTGVDAVRNGATSVTAGRSFLRPGYLTMAELFATAGYRTGLFGKWHLGDHYPHRPIDRGFQESVYHLGWGMLQATPEFDNPLVDGRYFHNGQPKEFQGHCTDWWFDSAIAWMGERQAAGEPFLCYLALNAPHGPHVELEKYVRPYQGKGPARFFGMIAHVDERFGDLEAFLESSGLRDNTIVLFMTDNGGTAGVRTFNAGLRAGKTTYYDGGHRAPCWMRWPAGGIAPGEVTPPTQVQDLLPTLMELCNIPRPSEVRFDGQSLASLLRGQPDAGATIAERMLVVQYGQQIEKWRGCVIWGKWRLVHGDELYDIEADRAQQRNLAQEQTGIVEAMRAHYEKWWAEVEPLVNQFTPCVRLGAEGPAEVELTSADWEGIYADNTGHVRNAVGGPRGGVWHIDVAQAGRYEIALRRWPKSSGAPLAGEYDATGETAALGGETYAPPSKVFPIAASRLEVAGQASSAKAPPLAQETVHQLTLPAGPTTLQAWFQDENGVDLCGAFFAYVRRAP